MDDWWTHLQWPAMVVTVLAAWLIGSTHAGRRRTGFWLFLLSNGLWIAWGVHDGAWALVMLQFALATLNIRGERKAHEQQERGGGEAAGS